MAETPNLTGRQRAIYEFIRDRIINRGFGPTVREIGGHFGISSPNGVVCHLKALEKKGLIHREQRMSRAITLADATQAKRTSLPMAGQVAAGVPVLAEEQCEWVDFGSLFDSDSHFCLKVRGESMVDAQIADGDYAIVRKQETARNGEIAVVLVDDEATLKRFYRDGNMIRLEPANTVMEPIYVADAKVLGVLVGVIRRV